MHRETLVHAPLAQAFAFFADAGNLERLTPSWVRFSIRTAMPAVMRAGLEVTYLAGQTYLQPHPKELMLRNHV